VGMASIGAAAYSLKVSLSSPHPPGSSPGPRPIGDGSRLRQAAPPWAHIVESSSIPRGIHPPGSDRGVGSLAQTTPQQLREGSKDEGGEASFCSVRAGSLEGHIVQMEHGGWATQSVSTTKEGGAHPKTCEVDKFLKLAPLSRLFCYYQPGRTSPSISASLQVRCMFAGSSIANT